VVPIGNGEPTPGADGGFLHAAGYSVESDQICPQRRFLAGRDREEEALGAADKGIAALVKAKELIGGTGNADADGFSDGANGMVGFAQPQRAGGAKVEAVVAAIDLKSGGEASWTAGEIEKPGGLAMALHELKAFERFESADEDRRGGSHGLAHDIEHEVRAIVEKNVGVARREVHRTDARSWTAEMMPRGIAGRIGLRFHDAAAEASRGEIVDDNSSDKETSEIDGVRRKFSAAKAADREFRW
jgi:hypothetical protein